MTDSITAIGYHYITEQGENNRICRECRLSMRASRFITYGMWTIIFDRTSGTLLFDKASGILLFHNKNPN